MVRQYLSFKTASRDYESIDFSAFADHRSVLSRKLAVPVRLFVAGRAHLFSNNTMASSNFGLGPEFQPAEADLRRKPVLR